MSLYKLPHPSSASPAAPRANELKSSGPRTARAKARAAVNPLKHGRKGGGLARPVGAGGLPGECRAIWPYSVEALKWLCSDRDPDFERQAERLASPIRVFP